MVFNVFSQRTILSEVVLFIVLPLLTDKFGNTPLHKCVFEGHVSCCEFLIDRGSDLNAHNHQGDTPLHKAVERGHTKFIKMLLDAGSNVREVKKMN